MTQIAPIRKVFNIIDSCENSQQLRTCMKLADYYTQMVKEKGVVNHSLVKETIYIRINEKKEELGLANKFHGKIQKKKIAFKEIENELIENFS
ncbi:MAG: hypothetical protein GYA51_18370 [Candidatus Methanofastidiosa archaeon]|jgi:hypothetical protein|nr:hypothetical protein [Candidatus Methanofastidiosa archaeon]